MKYFFKYLFLFLLFLLPIQADAVWFSSSWTYKVKVEVAPTKVGTTTAITSFPVYVDLSDFPITFFSNSSSTGADIRVVESDDTTETPFELVSLGTSTVSSSTEYIRVDGDWVVPTGITLATFEVWGAGGGGGDGATTGGGGGGGGAYASTTRAVSAGQTYTIDVGTGGPQGAATSNGTAGASTTVSLSGAFISYAEGGRGGVGCSSSNCAGGAGGTTANSYGSTTSAGGVGGNGNNTGDLGGGGGAAGSNAGTGQAGSGQTAGAGVSGAGSGGTGGANAAAGSDGIVPGGGGGGGEENATVGTGDGADGLVKVTYYFTPEVQGFGELHFMADSLSTTSTSTFYVYYGNPAATAYAVTDTYGRNAVWAAYDAVYHLEGNDNSSTGANDGTYDTGVTYSRDNGKLGGQGGDFRGNTNDEIRTAMTFAANATNTTQAWVRYDGVPPSLNKNIWSYWNTSIADANARQFAGTNSSSTMRFGDNLNGTAVMGNTTWRQIVGTISPTGEKYFYLNAAVAFSKTTSLTAPQYTAFYIGSQKTAGENWNGLIDEVRVQDAILTQSWITTEYNNQSSPSTFLYIGAEETETAPPATGTSTDSGIIWFD